ncbi:MAG: ATP-binding protein, partial [Bdellovibrionaceae bacterium]|nr:ATP-binding protein [Pseudobdellovibrionaceae bacterium]
RDRYLASKAELDMILEPKKRTDSEKGGQWIEIGESLASGRRPLRIDPDAFFGKHAAVLGSTGSGKSCTIASLIQSIHEIEEVKRTTFIIFDINGEYAEAFEKNGSGNKMPKPLLLSCNPDAGKDRLLIPYWFMNSDDFVQLFQAAPGAQRPALLDALRELRERSKSNQNQKSPSADTPVYFKIRELPEFLEKKFSDNNEQKRSDNNNQERNNNKQKRNDNNYLRTMQQRIKRLLNDNRFEVFFGRVGKDLENPANVLAAFIRDILGIGAPNDPKLYEEITEGCLPFYDRQRKGTEPVDVVILDLSLLASEVLENVTALIGRLILEFLQRLGEVHERGSLPVVLVLEEAQNYIRPSNSLESKSVSCAVFERIAREGRKYGLGLVVASQRPSEVSKTVLSQCHSFIVHRLQNPEDLNYFKSIVPGIYSSLLDQLPALAPQTALVLGECTSVPALVRIRKATPPPKSKNPDFYGYWTNDSATQIDVEKICAIWEGRDPTQPIPKRATNENASGLRGSKSKASPPRVRG